MTMSLSIPLNGPEQASPEATPKTLDAREQEIEDLNAQISQMQATIKSLQTSLKPASSVPVPSASAVPAKVSAAPEIAPAAVHPKTDKRIWILLSAAGAAALILSIRKMTAKNPASAEDAKADTASNMGISSIKTPAYADPDASDRSSGSFSVMRQQDKHLIEPDEIDSMIEEAELYAIHGHLNNAIEILNNIIQHYPERVEVWLLQLSIFRGNPRQFETIARKFLQTVGKNDAWREIQQVGCCIDPENPLYFDPDMQTDHVKPENQRTLESVLVGIQALSKEDPEKNLSQFDHLRDGRLGSHLLDKGLIGQHELNEALKLQNKESKKCKPANPLESMVRPRSISDVLIRMGAVTEPELEHVLADFDPKKHGHCGNYLVKSGLIKQKQLHAALLQQLSGVMEDAGT